MVDAHVPALASQTASSLGHLIETVLRGLMYVVVAPGVYVTILLVGIILTWPQETTISRWLVAHAAIWRRTTDRLSDDPAFRTMCAVAGLIAMTLVALVITVWLAGIPRELRGPALGDVGHALPPTLAFTLAAVCGLVAGSQWVTRMRRANDIFSSLVVLATSMALTGTTIFFYMTEFGLHDILLILALGTMLGALITAARHPMLLHEGLFAELFVPRAL